VGSRERVQIVLAGADEHDLTKLAEFRKAGGYKTLAKARKLEPQAIVDELLASGLRGRGGAGFPMGRKASFLAKDTGKPVYLVVNADESEPGDFKDREIMFRVPHRLLEGCLITAHAIDSKHLFIYLRGEYSHEFEVLRSALDEGARQDCSAASPSSSTAAPARTSRRGRRSSSRSRANAASHARSRRSPQSRASTRRPP
jgi:NADH:ubiquinone oxidoreductase subunit F (NADH-binding)